MNVVIINDRGFSGGGASKVAVTSAIELARRGIDTHFFAAQGPIASELEKGNIRFDLLDQHDLLSSPSRISAAVGGVWNTTAQTRLIEFVANLPKGKTILHLHSWSKALSPSIFSALRLTGHICVATLHDYGFVCPNGGLYNYQTEDNCDLTPMSMQCAACNCDARSYTHKLWRLARHSVLNTIAAAPTSLHHAINVSSFAEDVYRPHLPSTLPSSIVNNPIDVPHLPPAAPASSSQFVFVGRLSREKGIERLAEVAAKIGISLKVYGDGPLMADLVKRHPEHSFMGWVDRQTVINSQREARALILPATWRETHGMVVSEAMALGVPCIVSSGTAPASFVHHDKTGLIFRNGDSEDLSRMLIRARDDDALVDRLGKEAYRQYWQAPLTVDAHVDALLSLYEKLVKH